jgi:hypothetical protein
VRDVRRDREDLARSDRDFLPAVVAEPEAQRTLEDVRDLLAFMRVRLDDRTSLQEDLRDHRALTVHEAALDVRGHALLRDAVPAVMRSEFHGASHERGRLYAPASQLRLRWLRHLGLCPRNGVAVSGL